MAREVALYELPKTLETVKVLDDSVLNAYNDSVKSNYNSDKARAVLSRFGKADGELTGSNPFMLVHLQNSGLISGRIAIRQDLENALRFNPNFVRGNYVDFGLALRTEGDSYLPNDLLAKNLAGQLKDRGIKLGKGKLIPVSVLKLREADSEYGLVFDLNENAEVEDLTKHRWDWTKNDGLAARAYLSRNGLWDSSDGLAGSSGDGRVVVVSGEATTKNFLDVKLAELQNSRDDEIEAIKGRYTKAEKILLGK